MYLRPSSSLPDQKLVSQLIPGWIAKVRPNERELPQDVPEVSQRNFWLKDITKHRRLDTHKVIEPSNR
jgi:hypothetical protein